MIVVFGSINVDIVVPVPHLPAPGETVLGSDYRIAPGGKGANQALAARRAGSDVVMCGMVGRDAFADIALAGLRRDGVDLRHVATGQRPTGCATITVDAAGENAIAVSSGVNLDIKAGELPDTLLGMRTILVLQREVPMAENAASIRRARDRGARIVLSLAPAGPIASASYKDIDILIANESEAATLDADVPRRLRQALIVTRGAAGAIAHLADGHEVAVPALEIDPVDTTGAGDTFAGVLAAGLDQGLDLKAAMRRASVAAALACLSIGAQDAMPERVAIEAAMSRLQG
ncbi:MAG TPA: ribokinase [Stellaceae bacterium]|nr:ribokinase [Stellaceae bacterium]